jgi:negative regulator of sigma E activity
MTDVVKEGLSACLDGELPQGELDLLLKRVARDAELRDAVGRYALIGEALRAERPAVASRDFASKIMAALDDEPALVPAQDAAPSIPVAPAVAAQSRRATRFSPALVRYLRPAAGMAIAAGVAAIAVLSLQQPEPGLQTVPNLVAANESARPTSPGNRDDGGDDGLSYVVPTSTSTASFVPAARLTNYVVAHSEYSSPLGRRSVLTGVLADDEEEAAGVVTGADEAANGPADVAEAEVQDAVRER